MFISGRSKTKVNVPMRTNKLALYINRYTDDVQSILVDQYSQCDANVDMTALIKCNEKAGIANCRKGHSVCDLQASSGVIDFDGSLCSWRWSSSSRFELIQSSPVVLSVLGIENNKGESLKNVSLIRLSCWHCSKP